MNVWVTGAQGLLGQALVRTLSLQGISHVGSTHQEADLAQPESLFSFASRHPTLTHIVNTAAYTQVDRAEREAKTAHCINAIGPEKLALLAREKNLHFLHLSTDYVFNGQPPRMPYREEEPTSPVNVYGKTKREGEERIFHTLPSACILRTSWLFDTRGSHFVSRILHALHTKTHLQIPEDQTGSPTFVPDLCKAILQLLSHSGLFHFANAGSVNRYDYACTLSALQGKATDFLEPVTSDQVPTLAKRPAYSALNIEKVSHALGYTPRSWKEALQECLHATAT